MGESAPEKIDAVWVGPYEAELVDGTQLVPGETTVKVSAGEAKESDYWRPTRAERKRPEPSKRDEAR